jgi:predicted DNA-binding transcriptional regulator AlpA
VTKPLQSKKAQDPWMTVAEVLAEVGVPRATWSRWQAQGKTPRRVRLPNGQLRIRRSWLEEWLEDLEVAA